MTVFVSVSLLVAAGLVCLASLYLAQQARKVQGAEEVERKYAGLSADVSVTKKGLNALEELVEVKLNRLATTEKRAKKKVVEPQEEDELSGLYFPSGRPNA